MQILNAFLQVSQDIGVHGRCREAFVSDISPGNMGVYTRWVWGGEGNGDSDF